MIHILHGDARPGLGPLAQRLFSSSLSTWTSTASLPVIATSSGGMWFIGNPGICRVALLGVWGGQLTASSCKDNAGPRESSTPITIAIESVESDRGSSYASPSDPSMTASQSHGCRHLSVHLALSSLSSHSGSVSVVCSSGCHASSSSDEGELGQLIIRGAQAWLSGLPLLGRVAHSSPGPWWTSPRPR